MSADISFFVEIFKDCQWQAFNDVKLDTPRMPILFYMLLGYGNTETKEKYKDIPILCQGGTNYGWPGDICKKYKEFITSEIYNTHAAGWCTLDMIEDYQSKVLISSLSDPSVAFPILRLLWTDIETLKIATCLDSKHIRLLVRID